MVCCHGVTYCRSSMSAAIYQEVTDDYCSAGTSPSLRPLSAKLLQLTAGWSCWCPSEVSTVSTECLMSGAGCSDHITPVLARLHWSPVRQRIVFETAVLLWKTRHVVATPCRDLHVGLLVPASIGVTSYGVLGHVPLILRIYTNLAISIHIRLQ